MHKTLSKYMQNTLSKYMQNTLSKYMQNTPLKYRKNTPSKYMQNTQIKTHAHVSKEGFPPLCKHTSWVVYTHQFGVALNGL